MQTEDTVDTFVTEDTAVTEGIAVTVDTSDTGLTEDTVVTEDIDVTVFTAVTVVTAVTVDTPVTVDTFVTVDTATSRCYILSCPATLQLIQQSILLNNDMKNLLFLCSLEEQCHCSGCCCTQPTQSTTQLFLVLDITI